MSFINRSIVAFSFPVIPAKPGVFFHNQCSSSFLQPLQIKNTTRTQPDYIDQLQCPLIINAAKKGNIKGKNQSGGEKKPADKPSTDPKPKVAAAKVDPPPKVASEEKKAHVEAVFHNVFKNNEAWIEQKKSTNKDYFTNLAKGQSPEVLYIGCSDSRVTAEDLMGLKPGEAFIHRNIANQVVIIDLNVLSVIEYAVKYLKVSHIVVCGHQMCGGIKAAMQSQDLGLLNPWLRNIRDVYRLHKVELNAIEDENTRYERLVELNVQEQCINVIKTPVVQQAMRKEGLQIHGWVFDIRNGKLTDLKLNFDKILEEIREIYHLD